jgi:hypothetical protein
MSREKPMGTVFGPLAGAASEPPSVAGVVCALANDAVAKENDVRRTAPSRRSERPMGPRFLLPSFPGLRRDFVVRFLDLAISMPASSRCPST